MIVTEKHNAADLNWISSFINTEQVSVVASVFTVARALIEKCGPSDLVSHNRSQSAAIHHLWAARHW
jgi:hypothetical protein